MTELEYDERMKVIEATYEDAKRKLNIEYALANNTVSIGDIVGDEIDTILVEKIKVVLVSVRNLPTCVYVGRRLKKDITPTKKHLTADVYQHYMKFHQPKKKEETL